MKKYLILKVSFKLVESSVKLGSIRKTPDSGAALLAVATAYGDFVRRPGLRIAT
jgi:hypothetical protein